MKMIRILQGEDALEWLKQQAKTQVSAPESDDLNAASTIETKVKAIIARVKTGGDQALSQIAAELGDPEPRTVDGGSPLVAEAVAQLPASTKSTIEFAASNIRRFAQAVMDAFSPVSVAFGSYSAGLDLVAVDRAACYVPGGRYALPSTALMTGITAQVAGVKEIQMFTPVLRPEILFAGTLCGVCQFHELGGAQAIAAAAFGTESIRSVNMIVGPGNAYVAEAKRQLNGTIGIDMLAGPSEIAVIADSGGNPEWVALDMLSQAEHDPDSLAYLFTDSLDLAKAVAARLPDLATSVGAADFVSESLGNSAILVFDSLSQCAVAANVIAPEHLVLHLAEPAKLRGALRNFGALFLGYHATVPYGDYAAGPNHTLPTNRCARFSGGLTPLTFLRAQSWLKIEAPAQELSRKTADFARLEGLPAHAAAATARIQTESMSKGAKWQKI